MFNILHSFLGKNKQTKQKHQTKKQTTKNYGLGWNKFSFNPRQDIQLILFEAALEYLKLDSMFQF